MALGLCLPATPSRPALELQFWSVPFGWSRSGDMLFFLGLQCVCGGGGQMGGASCWSPNAFYPVQDLAVLIVELDST